MTSENVLPEVEVAVMGPLPDGRLHVHAYGCKDTRRPQYRSCANDAEQVWVVRSVREVVLDASPPDEHGYDEADWYAAGGGKEDVIVYACVADRLPLTDRPQCAWYAMCTRDAVARIDMGETAGTVGPRFFPICQRCVDRAESLATEGGRAAPTLVPLM